MQPERLTLREWQVDWAYKAQAILAAYRCYIDTSRMGSGKTFIVLWLAQQLDVRPLIVCPVIMIDIWRRTAAQYGIPVVDVISYQSLRSQTGKQPRHGLLVREDGEFTVTSLYTSLVESGVLLVLDEMQYTKNNNSQYRACCSLVRSINKAATTRSRVALLSGSPFDKEKHAVSLLRMLGYMEGKSVLRRLRYLINVCNRIDTEATSVVLDEEGSGVANLCYRLYVGVVKKAISGAMQPETMKCRFDVKNAFYRISDSSVEELRAALDDLARAVGYNHETSTLEWSGEEEKEHDIGAVTRALVRIENAKVPDFARVARTILSKERVKLVISLNYTSTIDQLAALLSDYEPLILIGKTKNRSVVVQHFNESGRLLLMNTSIATGFSIHDTTGDERRFMLISPTYRMLDAMQAASRIYRDGTKSDAVVRIFHGKGKEQCILDAMYKKSIVLKGTLEETNELVLPGDYESEEEG
jgi:hypothetical protein